MQAIELNKNIYWIGANIYTNDLFEGIWPIPNGVSLNSYVIKSDKIAVIDLVRDWGGAPTYVLDQLRSIDVNPKDIDYFVLNHIEPDHTGWLDMIALIAQKAKIITTAKGAEMVRNFYRSSIDIEIVKSGDSLDLGQGKKLIFEEIPNVHWPETMATYEVESKILFSCDAFGSFGALKGSIFEDELTDQDKILFESETLRYYANIVSAFSNNVLRAIDKLSSLSISTIAPSHGIIWRNNPEQIINTYKTYANYIKEPAEPEVTVIWGSMYGNTERMLQSILKGLGSKNIPIHIYKVPEIDPSFILADAWKSAGLVFAMPTYEYHMFPPVSDVINLFSQKHFWHKKVMRLGSYGWVGGAQKDFEEKTAKCKWEMFPPIEFAGSPTEDDLQRGYIAAAEFAEEIKKIPSKFKH